jgi:hypothetical protein
MERKSKGDFRTARDEIRSGSVKCSRQDCAADRRVPDGTRLQVQIEAKVDAKTDG